MRSIILVPICLFGLSGCFASVPPLDCSRLPTSGVVVDNETQHYIVPRACSFTLSDNMTKYTARPQIWTYTKTQDSGFLGGRPYPGPRHVCRTVRKTSLTESYSMDGVLLIACPKHELGAINDRRSEGAKQVAYAKHWTLLHVPARDQ